MEQKLIDFIKQGAENLRRSIDVNRSNNADAQKDFVGRIEKLFLGEAILTDTLLQELQSTAASIAFHYSVEVFRMRSWLWHGSFSDAWTIEHPLVQKLVHFDNVSLNNPYNLVNILINIYIAGQLSNKNDVDGEQFIQFLYRQKFPDDHIIMATCRYSERPFYEPIGHNERNDAVSPERKLSKFGEYLLPLLQAKEGFLGLGKNEGVGKILDDIISRGNVSEERMTWVMFLYDHSPASLDGQVHKFLWNTDYNNKKTLDLRVVFFLLEKDTLKFESLVLEAMNERHTPGHDQFAVLMKLNEKTPGKYDAEIRQIGEAHLASFRSETADDFYYYDPYVNSYGRPLTQAYSEFLWQQDVEKATARITEYIHDSKFLTPSYSTYLDEKMEGQAVPLLLAALFKDPDRMPSNSEDYYTTLFDIFDKYDIKPHLDKILEFSVKLADKKTKVRASQTLARYSEEIFERAKNLLTEKTVDQRVTGALILLAIGTEKVEAVLNEAVDNEINDDTRDIMLESLQEKRFAKPYTLEAVQEMIAKAERRKKLSKWSEKFLVEEELPELYWKGTQTPLEQKDVRFLLYRMKRAQGLNSDIEAKQLINHLDQEKGQAFASALLTAFQESNADSKLKYYLTLAGLLGHDDMMHKLNMLFKKSVADKRVKMAEYVIGALAMIGTDKALRIVEVIYRKFANKKPALSKAAQDALTAAATELAISLDELADRIIPNFDFEGLYKTFSVEGEEYRAFINAEFKLNYFTEDNKLRKSLPSNVSKELKAEFKEIEKEINDVVKSQSGRLEKYMVEERRWTAEDWKTFFFGNPIMFVYALKLVWGVYDQQGNLINSFYCSEDTSLYTVNDEEVVLEDGQYVSILHPLQLSDAILTAWRDKLYAMSMVTMFPILERQIFRVDDKEKDLSYSKKFFGESVPKGADFVNTFLVKQNWIKSTGDGGRSEFTKHFKDGAFKAYASIDGPAAFYQGGNEPAKVFEISFMKTNWQDKVALKDVPAVFYSEVMSDIDKLIKAT